MLNMIRSSVLRQPHVVRQIWMMQNANKLSTISNGSILAASGKRVIKMSYRGISSTQPLLMNAEPATKDDGDEPVENEVEIAKEKADVSPEVEAIVDEILKLDMIQISQLSELFAEKIGLPKMDPNAAMTMNMGGGGGGGGAAEAEEKVEEKTEFEVKLTGFDTKSKIKVIKEIRTITGLGLKEAKALVEGAPKTVKGNIKKEEADEMKEKLEAVGATVEVV